MEYSMIYYWNITGIFMGTFYDILLEHYWVSSMIYYWNITGIFMAIFYDILLEYYWNIR